MVDGVGTTTYAYNAITGTPTLGADRLASIDGPFDDDTITYTYDELGRVASRSINATDNETDYEYDDLGRLITVTNPLGEFDYAYVNATERLDHVDYPNGQVTNYTYFNNAGDQRLQQIENLTPSPSNLSKFTYTYDANGTIQSWSKQLDAGSPLVSNFKYDAVDQLTEAAVPTMSSPINYVYRYDKAGNRTSEQIDLGVAAATHNRLNQVTGLSDTGPVRFAGSLDEPANVTVNGVPATVDGSNNFSADISLAPGMHSVAVVATDGSSNATTNNYDITVASGSSRTLTYDANGNLADDGAGKTYTWYANNQLASITQNGDVTEFIYDGKGRRVQEKLNSSLVRQWVWCDGPQPCEERDDDDVVTKRFYEQGEQISGDAYFFAKDHLGSVREMTDDMGAIQARYDYDPYGRSTKVSGAMEADFGFTGLYRHQSSGLSFTIYRAYDSDLGRWLSRDPIEEQRGINRYVYVRNDPINWVDSLGLTPGGTLNGAAIGAVVGAWVGGALGGGGGAVGGSFAAPGVGTVAGAYAGGTEGAVAGAALGSGIGARIGDLISNMAGTKKELLPKGGSCPYEPKKEKGGGSPRNKQGDYIDDSGNGWRWDPKKGEWDVQHPDGTHTNVGPNGEITHGANNF